MQLMKVNGNRTFFFLCIFITQKRVDFFCSGRKGLEQRTYQDDERIATLEQQLAEAQLIAEDSDRKYDEVIDIIGRNQIKMILLR